MQKYIENPLLLQHKNLKNHKFDFRQWVLVLSWEPLDVCVFESAYLKICGQEFDLKQYEDTIRHLSNYSLNKNNSNSKELTMDTKKFEEYMTEMQGKPFVWQKDMLPKIKDVVWRSLKAL